MEILLQTIKKKTFFKEQKQKQKNVIFCISTLVTSRFFTLKMALQLHLKEQKKT